MTPDILTVQNLTKSFGNIHAVNGLSFAVRRGEIFGFLGPNGAGKTTTLNMIEGLCAPDGGEICVFGMDITQHAIQIKRRIGVQQRCLLNCLALCLQPDRFRRIAG